MSLQDALLLDPPKLDVWVALRTDGAKGTGTEADPYDGSIRPKPVLTGITINHIGMVATVNSTNHGYAEGNIVVIAGATGVVDGPLYNGTFPIYNVTQNTFQYLMRTAPGANASGSLTCTLDPYQFDAVMRSLSAINTSVHLGPGTFETKGFSFAAPASWQPKSGWTMSGSGIDVTVLKLVGASIPHTLYTAIGNFWYDNSYRVTGFEASDFTVDCNMSGQSISGYAFAPVACCAFQVGGSHIRLRRIRAINFGTQSVNVECFVMLIGLSSPSLSEAVDCVIEDCLVEKPSENNARETSCLGIAAQSYGALTSYHRASAIRNCVVNCYYTGGVSSQPIPIKMFTSMGGLQWKIETYAPHNRTSTNNVALNNVYVYPAGIGVISAVFNGSFSIDQIVSPTELVYTLLTAPDGPNPGGGAVGVPFHATGASQGTGAVVEGNRVYGARFGNYGDTGSSKDFIVRNNYFSDVIAGVYHSMGAVSGLTSAVSLTANGTLATFTTPSAHGLLPGSAVQVSLALVNGNPNNPFNGYFEVLGVTSTTFTYQMNTAPGQNADAGFGKYAEYFRIRRMVVENNVIELSSTLSAFVASYGIFLWDWVDPTSRYIYLQIVVRGNVVRKVDDALDNNASGILLKKCQTGIIEQNVIDPAVGTPFNQNLSGALEYFANSTPAGVLLRGVDLQNAVKADELTTRVEDSLLMAM